MSLPPEKLNELKQVIHNHLNQLDIHNQIRHVLSDSLRENNLNENDMQKEGLLNILKEKGIVSDIMKTLEFKGVNTTLENIEQNQQQEKVKEDWGLTEEQKKFPIDPCKRYLYIQLVGGKAFLEHLQDPEVFPGRVTSTFAIHVSFMGQRYHSRSVACACEPAFEEGFLLDLKKVGNETSKQPDASMLLTLTDKIHLALIKTDPSGDSHLLGSHYLEWRGILCSPNGKIRNSIEINGVGAEAKVPIGIVDIRLDMIPRLQHIVTTDVITTQLNLERSRVSERDRLFLTYSKQWWREYLQIRSSHSNRLVKIFAQDENATHRLVCSFIRPLRAGRLLDTPRQAARFVSLLGFEKLPTMSGNRTEMWTSLASFVARKKGDVEDHAVLLCSLLLGFGMNAFVCIGTKAKTNAHAWVLTIDVNNTVLFWESLTGQRYVHESINPNDPPAVTPPNNAHAYRTIGCLFNHSSFYANAQPSDGVHVCSFDLYNEASWKKLNMDAIKSVCGMNVVPAASSVFHLTPSTTDPILKSNQLENELRVLVYEHRTDMGLMTVWDDELSYLLTPALASYEFEQCHGVTIANDDFQHSIRRHVPDGHTFKGFPIQFIHTNTRRAFATCLRSSICEQIICCRGDQVKLAVRVRVFPYPEDTYAVWIMFAAKYKSVL